MDQPDEEGDTSSFVTPQKMQATFKRRNRESILSPGSLRAGKTIRVKDDVLMERIQVMIKSELSFMRDDIRKEMYANADNYKNSMYADMRKELDKAMLGKYDEMYTSLKGEMQTLVQAEVDVMECIMQKKLDEAIASFDAWKTNVEKCIKEKDAVIEEIKGELAACKIMPKMEGENQPSMLKELQEIKEEVKTLREGEEQNSKAVSSWAERLSKTQEKVDEAEKWIEGAKKGKAQMREAVQTSTIINMTIKEEQKRKTRALHVRITGTKDTGNVEEEVKELLQRVGIPKPTHTGAWRVGKKGIDEKGNVKEKALIL